MLKILQRINRHDVQLGDLRNRGGRCRQLHIKQLGQMADGIGSDEQGAVSMVCQRDRRRTSCRGLSGTARTGKDDIFRLNIFLRIKMIHNPTPPFGGHALPLRRRKSKKS